MPLQSIGQCSRENVSEKQYVMSGKRRTMQQAMRSTSVVALWLQEGDASTGCKRSARAPSWGENLRGFTHVNLAVPLQPDTAMICKND